MSTNHSLYQLKKLFFSLLLMTATRLLPAQKIEEDDYLAHFSIENMSMEENYWNCGERLWCLSCYMAYSYYWNYSKISAPDQVWEIIQSAKENQQREAIVVTLPEQYMILPSREKELKNGKGAIIPLKKKNLGPF